MKYLGSDIVVQARTPEEFERYLLNDFARTSMFSDPAAPPQVLISRIDCGGVALYYTEVKGTYVRVAMSPVTEVTLAIITGGTFRACFGQDDLVLKRAQACIRLPGELMVHASEGALGFTVRIPINDVTLFRLRALPHRKLADFSHELEPCECADLTRLAQFLSLERERTLQCGHSGSLQLEALGQALKTRAMALITEKTNLTATVDPEMLRICLLVDQRLRAQPSVRQLASDMASQSLCSVRQLYRAFAEVAGVSPHDYQIRTRLQLLRQVLLEDLDAPLDQGELAHRFGVQTQSYLQKQYRLEYGETPNETRERFRDLRDKIIREYLSLKPETTYDQPRQRTDSKGTLARGHQR